MLGKVPSSSGVTRLGIKTHQFASTSRGNLLTAVAAGWGRGRRERKWLEAKCNANKPWGGHLSLFFPIIFGIAAVAHESITSTRLSHMEYCFNGGNVFGF